VCAEVCPAVVSQGWTGRGAGIPLAHADRDARAPGPLVCDPRIAASPPGAGGGQPDVDLGSDGDGTEEGSGEPDEPDAEEQNQVPGPRGSPSGPEDRIDLERAIERLPHGYRQVFVLHDVEGYTHEEIGGLLGIETGTSKSQLSHARRRLRAALDPPAWRAERRGSG